MKSVVVIIAATALLIAAAAFSGSASQMPEKESKTPLPAPEDLSGEFAGNSVTADIDKDGELEDILLGGFGYGIYRINIYVIKNDVHRDVITGLTQAAYHVTYVPDEGYAELMLVKVSDTEVHLYGTDDTGDGLIPVTDYGPLLIRGDELYVDANDFPFKTWEQVYGSLTQ